MTVRRLAALLPLLLVGMATAARPVESPAELVARGDAAWSRRAVGRQGLRAAAEPIAEAVSAYRAALEAEPDRIETRVRLLRALYFQGQHAEVEAAARRAVHARGRDLASEGIARLATELGLAAPPDPTAAEEAATTLAERPDAAALYFWAAAHWGLWGRTSGAFAAARQGVARRVRDHARIAALLDESYEDGGGHRILGRLHTEAPRIPMVTGWVDRGLAIAKLERALELAPEHRLNRLYLADALLRFRPARREEALAILESLLAEPPRAESALEDEALLADARELLAGAR